MCLRGLIELIVNKYPLLLWYKKKLFHYVFLRTKLKKQLKFKNNIQSNSNSTAKKILVPLIETSHYQYLQILIIAKALQLRGANVKVLLCGSRLDGCELKSSRTQTKDPCLDCRFNAKEVVPLFQLETLKLADFISDSEVNLLRTKSLEIANTYPKEIVYDGYDLMPVVNDSVVRFFYGKLPNDAMKLKLIRTDHLTTALITLEVAKKINEKFNPDIIFNNMNVYTAWEPYYKYFKSKEKNLFTCSMSTFNFNAIVLNRLEYYMSNDRYDKFRSNRNYAYLNEEENNLLNNFVSKRTSLNTDIFKKADCFEDNQNIKEKLSIDLNKRNIFLFSNIYWDVGLSETGKLFENIIDWVLETIDLVKYNQELHLYIKTHPWEKYDTSPSSKGIVDFIHEKYPSLPQNVTLILPEYKISPYQLFPYINLGILFNGTLGLEMLLFNLPVVITGMTPFGGLGFSHEPDNTIEYKKILLGETSNLKPLIEDVRLFAYFYFIKSLIPWTLTNQAYGDVFKGFKFDSLNEIMPGKDRYLDHICNCILDPKNNIIENWK
jgi:hypothetical protein